MKRNDVKVTENEEVKEVEVTTTVTEAPAEVEPEKEEVKEVDKPKVGSAIGGFFKKTGEVIKNNWKPFAVGAGAALATAAAVVVALASDHEDESDGDYSDIIDVTDTVQETSAE